MKEAEAIDRLRKVLRRQHKALATEDAYVHWLRRYIRALPQMPSGLSSEKKLEKFLTDLALKQDVSAISQSLATAGARTAVTSFWLMPSPVRLCDAATRSEPGRAAVRPMPSSRHAFTRLTRESCRNH